MAFAPDYASSGRFYVYYTDSDGDQRVVEYQRASADRADAGSRAAGPPDGRPRVQPQRRAAAVRPGRPALHRHRRRRRRRRPARRARQRAEPRLAARQDPADRPAARRRARRTRSRARTRSSGAPARAARSTATACATRGASRSTAAPATSRSATSARTRSRRSTSCAAGRGENFGWRPFEGRSRYTPGETAPGHVAPRHPALPQRGQLLDHRRRRRPRPRACRRCYGRYVFGDFCRGRIESARLRPGRARAPSGPRGCASRACPRSARTPAAASTRSRWTARSTGSSRGAASG